MTFILNLSVSFLMAFGTAVRAYGFPRKEVFSLMRRLSERVGARPFDFFLPVSWPAHIAPQPQPETQSQAGGAPILDAE